MNKEKKPTSGSDVSRRDHRNTFLLFLALFLLFSCFVSLKSVFSVPPTTDTFILSVNKGELVLTESKLGKKKIPETKISPEFSPFFFEPIPINFATAEILATIPGVGGVLASSIITQREKGGLFSRPEDLLKVNGIGRKRMKWLANEVSFESR